MYLLNYRFRGNYLDRRKSIQVIINFDTLIKSYGLTVLTLEGNTKIKQLSNKENDYKKSRFSLENINQGVYHQTYFLVYFFCPSTMLILCKIRARPKGNEHHWRA